MAKKVRAAKRANKPSRLRIFISHSDRDKVAVDKISQRLNEEGYATWDNRSQVKAGDNFQRKILEELADSDVLLIIVSKNSFRSEWAQQEFVTIVLQQEITNGSRRIIPIKIDEISVPSYLAHLQYLDFSQDFEAGMDRLVADLRPTRAVSVAKAQAPVTPGGDSIETQVRALREALQRGRFSMLRGARTPTRSCRILSSREARSIPKILHWSGYRSCSKSRTPTRWD
jgi:TIR domain